MYKIKFKRAKHKEFIVYESSVIDNDYYDYVLDKVSDAVYQFNVDHDRDVDLIAFIDPDKDEFMLVLINLSNKVEDDFDKIQECLTDIEG